MKTSFGALNTAGENEAEGCSHFQPDRPTRWRAPDFRPLKP